MARYQRHVFVCINERPPNHPKGCCLLKGSAEVREMLKAELAKRGLARTVRANNSGCLDACEFGISMVIYPDGIWYGGVKKEDIPEIIERTIMNGEVIERLLINDERYAPDAMRFPKLILPKDQKA
jgi:(2Fe-2S) ferredoxin